MRGLVLLLVLAQPEIAPERRVIVFENGQERLVDADEAVKAGYTIVSLREDWTPYIFEELPGPDGRTLPNRYRTIFLGLANDTTDGDGQPLLPPDDGKKKKKKALASNDPPPHNYLEVYGIPPTLSVLRARFLEDAPDAQGRDRCAEVDREKLLSVPYIVLPEPNEVKKWQARLKRTRLELEKRRKKLHLHDWNELAAKEPKWQREIDFLQREELGKAALPEVEKRLTCEGFFRGPVKHQPGVYDEPFREALIRFQRKHKIYAGAALTRDTMTALTKSMLELDQAALERVLTERVVSAWDVLEDGSTEKPGGKTKEGEPRPAQPLTYKNSKGETVPLRNLVQEGKEAILSQMGLTTPEATLAFFKRHPAEDFKWMRVGIKLPPKPEYYAPDMDLSIEIDRGDVFYDPPYDAQGKKVDQTRHHFPTLRVLLKWNNQTIPLVKWRTTIGGWRSDLAPNGYEYFRYKGSDVGPRVWRHIVAGPVWIAPPSTPIRTLVKSKTVNGKWQRVVNYDEVGPGFLSAYGLVAAYNVVPGKDGKPDWDNGIRVHGSSEFRSMFDPDGYSHGCHRLVNHLAERMFSWILQHHKVVVEGDQPLNFSRQFLWKDEVFEMRLPSRGYRFVLDPPVPVKVLEGNILGETKKPIMTYVPKPGVVYPPGPIPIPPNTPEARAAGGGGDQ